MVRKSSFSDHARRAACCLALSSAVSHHLDHTSPAMTGHTQILSPRLHRSQETQGGGRLRWSASDDSTVQLTRIRLGTLPKTLKCQQVVGLISEEPTSRG